MKLFLDAFEANFNPVKAAQIAETVAAARAVIEQHELQMKVKK